MLFSTFLEKKSGNTKQLFLIISPNEVFGDIMVLASPLPPRPPPVDPDDVNTLTRKIFNFQILYVGRYPPEVLCY